DGDTLAPAMRAAAEYRGALKLFRPRSANWDPPVLTVSALEGRGMDAVWSAIQDHRDKLSGSGELAAKRRQQQQDWLWAMIDDGLKHHFLGRPDVARALPEIEAAVLAAKLTPTEGARRLLALLDEHGGGEAAPIARRGRGG